MLLFLWKDQNLNGGIMVLFSLKTARILIRILFMQLIWEKETNLKVIEEFPNRNYYLADYSKKEICEIDKDYNKSETIRLREN